MKPRWVDWRHWRDRQAKKQGYRCHYCKRSMRPAGISHPREATLDHMIPKTRGGKNNPSNYAVACRTCNEAKANLTAEEFFEVLADFRRTNSEEIAA